MGNKRKKRRSRKRRRQEQRAVILAGLVIFCAIIVILAVQLVLRSYIKKADSHRIIQGVTIGNIDVSGLTAKKASAKVEDAFSSNTESRLTVELEDGRSGEVPLSSFGIYAKDLDEVVQEAVDYGKKGSAVKCYKILKKAQKNENQKNFSVTYSVKKKDTKIALENALASVLNMPENAKMTHSDSGASIEAERPGEVFDIDKTVKSINEFLRTKWDGGSGTVKAYVVNVEPDITSDDLKDVTDLLGSYSTYYGSDGTGRSINIESGTQHINGTLLKPGEEVSANALMEPYTEENGYAMAASYESDTVVESMGGGICQISTTLYNALLYAELEITQRSPHTMLVSYVEPSQDAAIADDVLDLRFKNNLSSPVYIAGVLSDGSVTFSVYGKETRDPGRSLEFISEVTSKTVPEGKRFVATDDSIGNYYVKQQAQAEISAQLWKVVYLNGEEQSRDIINYSQYVPAKETIAVGSASDNAEFTSKIQNAVSTQDEAQILAAIQEITGG